MTIRLHHIAQSRSFRALWMLHEAGLPFELIPHSFDKSLRAPDYLALSPAGRVPSLEIDGQCLSESGAIVEYLAETHAPHLSRPQGHKDRAAYLQWLHFGETVGQHLANLTQHHIALREPHMRSLTVMKLEARRLSICLEALAAQAGQGWLLPSGISGADIQCGYGLWLGQRFTALSDTATAYLGRLTARPAFKLALGDDGPALIYTRDFYPVPEV
jgi:glutathione S-transferase